MRNTGLSPVTARRKHTYSNDSRIFLEIGSRVSSSLERHESVNPECVLRAHTKHSLAGTNRSKVLRRSQSRVPQQRNRRCVEEEDGC